MISIQKYIETLPALAMEAPENFGATERRPITRYEKFAGPTLTRNSMAIPHVTHHEELDVTDLESRREAHNRSENADRLSLLPFVVKAVAATLGACPMFNASIDEERREVVLKKYFHIGIAVDTPHGLLVPVIKDCDTKSVSEIGAEIAAVAQQAREKGLPMSAMTGGCFSVSSLGARGGTGFTPIINAPEVAILGISRTRVAPAPASDGSVQWRQLLPLSLSYDHRVINGAAAGEFFHHFAQNLDKVAI